MTRHARRPLPYLLLLLLLAPGSLWAEGGERGPTRTGLPGLTHTITAPIPGSAPVRFGLYWDQHSVDPGHGVAIPDDPFGPPVRAKQLRFQVGMHATRYLFLSGSLPLRWIDRVGVNVGTVAEPEIVGDAEVSGLGDAELGLTGQIWTNGRGTVGGWGQLRLPVGVERDGLSTGQVDGEFGLHARVRFFSGDLVPETHVHANLGFRINKNESEGYGVLSDDPTESPSTTGVYAPLYPASPNNQPGDNDELLLRLAVEFQRRWARLSLEAAVDWLWQFDDASFQESASWITPGVDLGPDNGPRLKAAWSIGLAADDAGTSYRPTLPDWVFSTAVSVPFYLGGRDRDGDLVPDDEDACPDEPEDLDGYLDGDGCPDDDNDMDGIPDRRDLAPNLAEDFDGFEDDDGRPELDNDLDGIPDDVDQCPRQAEDFDGFEDADGCPDVFLDRDGDGVEDALDACPDQPEDLDGFEDGDGCPDPDNDLDGIPDTEDECPNEPETYNGVDDDDGCPDAA